MSNDKRSYLKTKKTNVGSDPKSKLTVVFDEYKALLNDKVHPDNHTAAYNQSVVTTLNRLVSAADELDTINPGEGVFGLLILSLRSSLALKDKIIKLEVDLKNTKNELNKVKKIKSN